MKILEENDKLKLIVDKLTDVAKKATCKRSKCGSVLISEYGNLIGSGYNSMPCNVDSACFKDELPTGFKSDKTCCIHAEQRAIMEGLKHYSRLVEGSTLYFLRLDDNDQPKQSGQPYCSICSKMALDAGIKYFVLWHKEGWTAYETEEYNSLTFKYE